MNKDGDFNAGVDVVQPLPNGMVNMLNDQDGLYHVYLKGIKDGKPITEFTMVDCINKGINPVITSYSIHYTKLYEMQIKATFCKKSINIERFFYFRQSEYS